MSLTLQPGTYLIEVETTRDANADVFRRGLEAAGFDSIVADEPGVVQVPPEVGAAMAVGPRIAPKAVGPSPPAVARPAGAPTLASQVQAIREQPANSPLRGGGAFAPSHLAATARPAGAPTLAQQVKAIRAQPYDPKYKPHGLGGGGGALGQAPSGGGGDGGGGDGGGEAPHDIEPDPNDERYAVDMTTGTRYFLDDDGSVYQVDPGTGELLPVDQTTLQPVAGPRRPAPAARGIPVGTAMGTFSAAADLAGPLGEDPAFSISIGGAVPSGVDCYRLVARTPASVALKSSEGVSWSARRLAVDPYADVSTHTGAHPLLHGMPYDLVLLARDRRARSRGDVWTLAEAMGFDPHAISLLQRDIRLPGRPNASYSRWLLVATWQGPDTISTAEEPLVLEQVVEAPLSG